jgi:hypothetical protein
MLSVLRRLSRESYDRLRVKSSFGQHSFAMPADPYHPEDEDARKRATRLVGTLGGKWRFNYEEGVVEYFILPTRHFHTGERLSIETVLSPWVIKSMSLSQRSSSAKDEYKWLTMQIRMRIVELYN